MGDTRIQRGEIEQVTAEQMGQALKNIRDNRLYREISDSFYGYCEKRWKMNPKLVNWFIAQYEGKQNAK